MGGIFQTICDKDLTWQYVTKSKYLRLFCYINAFIFNVHYLCLIGLVYVFYGGHVDKSSLYETLLHYNILSKHRHHHHHDLEGEEIQYSAITKWRVSYREEDYKRISALFLN
jgi:hypothetical protein